MCRKICTAVMIAKNSFLAVWDFWPKLPRLTAHTLPCLAQWINAKLTNDHDAVLICELIKKLQIWTLQFLVYQISHGGIEGKTWCLLRLLPYVESKRERERDTSSGCCKAEEQQNEYHQQHISIRDGIMFESPASQIDLHLCSLQSLLVLFQILFILKCQWWRFEARNIKDVGPNPKMVYWNWKLDY